MKMVPRLTVPFTRFQKLDDLAWKSGSDKGVFDRTRFRMGHGYTRVYNEVLKPYRDASGAMVEIGLQRQKTRRNQPLPSLQMWRKFLPKMRLIGFDIIDHRGVSRENTTVLQGDQSDRNSLRQIIDAAPGGIDVVIDDGSHQSLHQQTSFAVIFPHMKSGGVYMIEDMFGDDPAETKALFRNYAATSRLAASTIWSAAEAESLGAMISRVAFFDSLKAPDGGEDCLAVIYKR
jgi:hypothetical protein